MRTYAEFRPTSFDPKGLGLPDRQDWIVLGVSRIRDSGSLDESNFATARRILDEAKITHEVHRFGHWGPGWFEIILVEPTEAGRKECDEIQGCLEQYAVLDDHDFSEREFSEACEAWRNASTRERVELLQRDAWPKAPTVRDLMQARRDEYPRDDNGRIQERLLRT